MRVSKSELNDFGLFESLPQPLKDLAGTDKFIFYYDVIEKESKLKVFEYRVVKDVNVSLYRDITGIAQTYNTPHINIGFFTETFETRDGLFYQFLRTYNDYDKVKKFYSFLAEQDKIVDLNVSTDSMNEINISDDFRRSISYFCKGRMQTIMFVYDMVDHACKRRLSKSIYGNMIKKVVNLVLFDGGVLPEMGGKLRFMVIGENAKLTPQQKEKLIEAKLLIRSMQSFDKVYQYTGWALSENDGKWRTNIADNEASINDTLLYDYQGRKLYIPSGSSLDDMQMVLKDNNKVSSTAYRGRLIELLKHPTLYDYYPRLAIMPIFYHYGDAPSENSFYYAPDERGGYIIINGSKSAGDSLSILLHEIQHYIQDKEGFSTGGNLFLAQFVASVGSDSVRKIFACINRMQRTFIDYFYNDVARIELIEIFKNIIPKNDFSKQLKNQILEILVNNEEFNNKYKTLNFYLVLFVAEEGDFTTSDVVTYMESKMESESSILYELFGNIQEGYNASKNYQKILINQGYTQKDINTILFKGYENLYGEMESRSVQSSRFVESEFKNYFYLTRWENTPFQKLTIIDGVEEIIDLSDIVGACESKDGQYVMHFTKQMSSLSYIHELGHIVHDALNQLGYGEIIQKQYDKDVFADNVDEFFVEKFLGYLKVRVDDEKLLQDLSDTRITDNSDINNILDDFFADTTISDRLKFLQSILLV